MVTRNKLLSDVNKARKKAGLPLLKKKKGSPNRRLSASEEGKYSFLLYGMTNHEMKKRQQKEDEEAERWDDW